MKYGSDPLGGKFILGPMAAYTDLAFRLLCRKHGASMCFTEFSNANALVRGIAESWRLCRTAREEMPVGIQIFGSSSEMIAKAARMISEKVEAGIRGFISKGIVLLNIKDATPSPHNGPKPKKPRRV
jgi:tRNA-dihydrouridine synthase